MVNENEVPNEVGLAVAVEIRVGDGDQERLRRRPAVTVAVERRRRAHQVEGAAAAAGDRAVEAGTRCRLAPAREAYASPAREGVRVAAYLACSERAM